MLTEKNLVGGSKPAILETINEEHRYPNQWKEQQNLAMISPQITNRNRFNEEDIVSADIKNKKYLDVIK